MFIRILKFLDSNKYTIGLFLSVFLCAFAASAETFDALNNAGIKQIPGVTGNPDEAAEAFLKGTLTGNPNAVCAHKHNHVHN